MYTNLKSPIYKLGQAIHSVDIKTPADISVQILKFFSFKKAKYATHLSVMIDICTKLKVDLPHIAVQERPRFRTDVQTDMVKPLDKRTDGHGWNP